MAYEPTLADYADYYRMGLDYGFITPHEVMEWADHIILEEPEPDPEIIEVSLNVRNPKVMIESLTKLGKDSTDHVVNGLVIRGLGDYLINNPNQISETLQLIQSVCYAYEYEIDEAAGLHDS